MGMDGFAPLQSEPFHLGMDINLVYRINFETMHQQREGSPDLQRRVRRIAATAATAAILATTPRLAARVGTCMHVDWLYSSSGVCGYMHAY